MSGGSGRWSETRYPPCDAAAEKIPARWHSATQRALQVPVRVLAVVGSSVAAAALVVVPWALAPLLGHGRWSAPVVSGRWIPIVDHLAQAHSPSLEPERPAQRSFRRRWQPRVVGLVLVFALVFAGFSMVQPQSQSQQRASYALTEPGGVQLDQPRIPAAFAGEEWYPKYERELDYAATWFDAVPLVDGTALQDFTSTYLNVDGGYRRTWVPPECDCPRMTVWMYGASTVFGLGQRDEQTIASQLAKAAWSDGIALDVENRGIPGEQHWQEANRLRWDLSRRNAPDVVVFYDGASEIVGASWLEQQRLPDVTDPVEPMTEQFLASPAISEAIAEFRAGGQTQPPVPEGISVAPDPVAAPRSPEEVGQLAVTRYERARRMSLDLTRIHGLRTFWFWQPTRVSRPPVEGEPTTPADADSRLTAAAAVSALPEGVHDLTDALARSSSAIYSDDVHHNEEGARLIASEMYQRLRPSIERIAQRDAG